MRAMVLDGPARPLREAVLDDPVPAEREVLVEVEACAVCRTDLHIVDGELSLPRLPLVPGHQVVGRVLAGGSRTGSFATGQRVGVAWLASACGECEPCRCGRENLCGEARFTGLDRHGGFAEKLVALEDFCFPLDGGLAAEELAPLLCAGLIGYRSLKLAGPCSRLGLYGFGAAAHILTQLARSRGVEIYAFTRPGDAQGQRFARGLGARWAGGSDQPPPVPLDAAIIFAPVGSLIPEALRAVRPGGTVVCGGIHMSPIPEMPYSLLWGERVLRSVANLTRADGREFLSAVGEAPIRTSVRSYPLAAANEALDDLRSGRLDGAAVLLPALG